MTKEAEKEEKNHFSTAETQKHSKASESEEDQAFFQQVLRSFEEQPKALTEKESEEQKKVKKRLITFSTPETKLPSYPSYFYVGFWIRLWAFLIDLLCIQALTALTFGQLMNWTGGAKTTDYLSVYGLGSLLIYLMYFVLLTKLNHGQTIGKMIFGIRVIAQDTEELDWGTVLIREGICRFILKYPFLFIGYFPAAFTKQKMQVGDFFAGTRVVSINLIKASLQE